MLKNNALIGKFSVVESGDHWFDPSWVHHFPLKLTLLQLFMAHSLLPVMTVGFVDV